MKPVCEYMISDVLPGFRALVAKKLMDDHGFSQTQVSVMLDTTQPAISQYKRNLRGKKTEVLLKNPDLLGLLDSITKGIANGDIGPKESGFEFCKVCKLVRKNNLMTVKTV